MLHLDTNTIRHAGTRSHPVWDEKTDIYKNNIARCVFGPGSEWEQ